MSSSNHPSAETVVTLGRGLKVRVTHTEMRTLQQWLVVSFATGPVMLAECPKCGELVQPDGHHFDDGVPYL